MPHADPEVRKAYAKAAHLRRYAVRRDEYREKARAKYREDPSKQRKASLKWMASNLDVVRLNAAKHRAKRDGREFNLTIEDVAIPDFCPILGIKLVPQFGRGSGVLADAPTLDRKDNTKGYIKGNVWTISGLANVMKSSASPEQLRAFANWVRKEYGE